MDGDDRVRFCRECNRNVYNLSAMSETEARRIVEEREGHLCVRFFQRRDGTVLTSDCPVGQKRSFLVAGARTVAAVAGVAAGLTTLSACGSAGNDPVQMGEPLMGTSARRDARDPGLHAACRRRARGCPLIDRTKVV
jgi:hypothetical protein